MIDTAEKQYLPAAAMNELEPISPDRRSSDHVAPASLRRISSIESGARVVRTNRRLAGWARLVFMRIPLDIVLPQACTQCRPSACPIASRLWDELSGENSQFLPQISEISYHAHYKHILRIVSQRRRMRDLCGAVRRNNDGLIFQVVMSGYKS